MWKIQQEIVPLWTVTNTDIKEKVTHLHFNIVKLSVSYTVLGGKALCWHEEFNSLNFFLEKWCQNYIMSNNWLKWSNSQFWQDNCSYTNFNVTFLKHRVITFSTHTHTRLTALCPGQPRWAGTRKENPIWILLKQETVSGSGIRWAICKSAPRFSQITMPAPHHSVFYRPYALPAAHPTASKHWRQ